MTSPERRRRLLPWALTAVFALVALAAIGNAAGVFSGPCTVHVTTSPEKFTLLSRLADDYARTSRAAEHCPRVQVTGLDSGKAAQALGKLAPDGAWDEADGPRPDVWTPAASTWIGVARGYGAAPSELVPEAGPSLARTPLVIAMPKPMAVLLGWPNGTLGWGDLRRLSQDPQTWTKRGFDEWGPFTLGKTDPNASTSGLHALLTAYQAAPGPGPGVTPQKINSTEAGNFELDVERGAVHYGRTELTFLRNLYEADRQGRALTYVSAVAVEEKSVRDYNLGNPGDAVVDPSRPPVPPAVPLVAFAPREGTLVSDSPYLVLNARWVDDATRAGADDFSAWLRERPQQERFQDAGFRDATGAPGATLTTQNGTPPGAPPEMPAPSTQAVNAALASWSTVRKPANVTLVIDRSGTMCTPVSRPAAVDQCSRVPPGQGPNRLDDARQAALDALGSLTSNDKLGLVSFSSAEPGEPAPYREDVPLDYVARTSTQISPALQTLTPYGETALYRTTRTLVDAIRGCLGPPAPGAPATSCYDPNRINAIVLLTDGQNNDRSEESPAALDAALAQAPGDRNVRVFTIAYGSDADRPALQDIADRSRGVAYATSEKQNIEQVFEDVLTNF